MVNDLNAKRGAAAVAGSDAVLLPEVLALCARSNGVFIDGAIKGAESRGVLVVYDPANGQQIAVTPDCGAKDVDAVIASAYAAFTDGRWSGLTPAQRERVLLKFADLVDAHSEELAQLVSLEQGKSINIARGVEVGGGASYLRYCAGLATKITGRTLDVSIPIPPGARYTAYTRREPLGVVAGIVPWNFPLMIAIWKIAPALAAGNTIVLKPSETTPLTALRLAELAIEAGVPSGAFNVVTGRGASAGAALVSDPRVAKISFTGSTETGKAIGRAAVDTMAKTSLELGGMNPAIVFEDADFDNVTPGLMTAAFLNQGQVCAAAGRVLVQRTAFDACVRALSEAIGALSVGPGLNPDAQVNPLASTTHQKKVVALLEQARSSGARIVSGGQRAPDPRGYYVPPALVIDPSRQTALRTQEVFGPVLAIIPFDSEDDAVALANETSFGLAASIWTSSIDRTMNLIPRIQAGTVWVNSHIFIDPNMPFGGYKQSGQGRDFGPDWLDSYTQVKSVCIAH